MKKRGRFSVAPSLIQQGIRFTVVPKPAPHHGDSFASKQNGKVSKDVRSMTFEFITGKIIKLPAKAAVSHTDRRG